MSARLHRVQTHESTQEGIVPLLLQSGSSAVRHSSGGVNVLHTGRPNDTPKAPYYNDIPKKSECNQLRLAQYSTMTINHVKRTRSANVT